MGSPTDRTEQLLAHAGWVRRLAGHLVRDPERAEDLVQDTWVAALRHPPRASGSAAATRAFLGRILRNALHQSARSEAHRRDRERASARNPIDPSGSGLAEEVDSQRMLLEEVLKLSEPARETVLLRYFRGWSAAEIARDQEVPAGTVRSRLKRALAELRERLDTRHGGDRSAWSIGVLAWAHAGPGGPPAPHGPPSPTTSPVPNSTAATLKGVIAMKATKTAAIAGVALLAALGLSRLDWPAFGTSRDDPRPVDDLAAATQAVAPLVAEPRHAEPRVAPDEAEEPRRVAVAPAPKPTPIRAAAITASAPPTVSPVTATFVDGEGLALPGVEFACVRLLGRETAPAAWTALSGGDGLAQLEIPVSGEASFGLFRWRAEGFQMGSLETRLVLAGPTDLGTISLSRGSAVSGFVVDLAGRPLAGARVWAGAAELPAGDAGQIERKGPASVVGGMFENDTTPTVESEQDGSFRIPGVAAGRARVWAHLEGMKYCSSAPFDVVPDREVQGVEVVVLPLAAEDRIEGIVLSEDGAPLPDSAVRYSLRDGDLGLSSEVRADEEGRFRLVVWRRVPHSFTVRGGEGQGTAHAARVEPGTLDLVLRLGQQDSFELVVRDPDGRPIESYRVQTCVGTEHSWTGRVEPGEEHPGGRVRLGKAEDEFWIEVDAVGYALGKLGPYEPANVPELLELVLDPAPSLTGRVFANGAPQAGVEVSLYRAIDARTFLQVNGFPAYWQNTGGQTRTDEQGTFVLMSRAAGEYLVRAELDGWAPGESRPVRLAANAGASDVDVHLGHGGTLVVQVEAPAGRTAAGAVVAVTRGDGHPRTRRADGDGRAVFGGLLPGHWNVLATEEELDPYTTSSSSSDLEEDERPAEPEWVVDVHEGRTARYTLVLAGEQDRGARRR